MLLAKSYKLEEKEIKDLEKLKNDRDISYTRLLRLLIDSYETKEIAKKKAIKPKKPSSNDKSIEKSDAGEINQVIDSFKTINPMIGWNNKTIRGAAGDLLRQFGLSDTLRMAKTIVEHQGREFCPVINDPYKMKEKLANFAAYMAREKDHAKKHSALIL